MGNQVIEVLESKLTALVKRSFQDLSALPEVTSEDLIIDGKKFIVSIWVDQVAPDTVRVVAQSYHHYLLGIGSVSALGFTMTTREETRWLKEDETYDFR